MAQIWIRHQNRRPAGKIKPWFGAKSAHWCKINKDSINKGPKSSDSRWLDIIRCDLRFFVLSDTWKQTDFVSEFSCCPPLEGRRGALWVHPPWANMSWAELSKEDLRRPHALVHQRLSQDDWSTGTRNQLGPKAKVLSPDGEMVAPPPESCRHQTWVSE